MTASFDSTNFDAATSFQLALQLHQQNRLSEAEISYRRILDLHTNFAPAVHFLGMIYFARKDIAQALEHVEQSLRLDDKSAVFYNNYGIILKEMHQYTKAQSAFEQALNLNPTYPDALSNIAVVLTLLKQPDDVVEQYLTTALSLQPNHLDALHHLSDLYIRNKRLFEARDIVEKIVRLIPENEFALHRLAGLHGDCGSIAESKKSFQKAAALPKGKQHWKWKHLWYCPTFFNTQSQIDDYWHHLHTDLDAAHSERLRFDWRTLPYDGFAHSFNLTHLDRCVRDVLEKFANIFSPSFPFERPIYRPGKKIKVGFLVTPTHEGGFLRMNTGTIERLDPRRFEVVLFYSDLSVPFFQNRIQQLGMTAVQYPRDFEKAVRMIQETRCDIIYYWKVGADLWSYFLPMCRLAPVQATAWGTHGTTGLEQIDYYLTWSKAEIASAQEHYTECLHRFENPLYYEPVTVDRSVVATRSELGVPETGTIYFCPHRLPKYQPVFDGFLKEILERDPTGHILLLLGKSHSLNELFIGRMKKTIGKSLFQRMILLPKQTLTNYYKYCSIATVILNSPVYSGKITLLDGFFYGVPSVSLNGPLLIQRFPKAYYDQIGLDGLATDSKNEYIIEALKLGMDAEYRNDVSKRIIQHHSILFENESNIRSWEDFFQSAIDFPLSTQ